MALNHPVEQSRKRSRLMTGSRLAVVRAPLGLRTCGIIYDQVREIAALAAAVLVTTPALAAPVSVPVGRHRLRPSRSFGAELTATGSLTSAPSAERRDANRHRFTQLGQRLTCGGTTELQCSGTTSVPTYNVRGTNNAVVSIIKTASLLTNANDSTTLSMTPSGAASVTLTNAGAPGTDFNIGGSIVIGSATTDGVYSGFVNVQVDYQ